VEKEIERLTKTLWTHCEGQNSAVCIGAGMNLIQTCMTYGNQEFQRATAESLRGMANIMLQAIGKPKN
jgi:hypothetical protein